MNKSGSIKKAVWGRWIETSTPHQPENHGLGLLTSRSLPRVPLRVTLVGWLLAVL
ncbi:MAG: hypothetical protein QXS54_00760 [Candidatus Methanomethylicaceae archaeon]